MGRILKKSFAIILSLAMIFSLAACGSKPNETGSEPAPAENAAKEEKNEPIVIKYPTFQVGVNPSAPLLQQNIEEFHKLYGDEIRVEIEEIPGDQAYVDKMKVLLSADELPDLIYAGGYNLLDAALEKGVAVDLTPYLEEDSDWKAMFTQRDLDFNSRDGKIYSVPEERQMIGYFYNKELFAKAGVEAPPKTWDEFFEVCDKLKAAGITPLSMDTADTGWLTSLWMNSIIGTNGDAGNKFMNTVYVEDYSSPEFLDATAKIQKMFLNYTTSDAVGGKYENGANNFLSGKTAMIANGPWMIEDFKDTTKAPEGFIDKVGVAAYPGSGIFDAPMLGYFVASKDKEHADATVKFLKFLTSKETQLRGLDMLGRIPTSEEIQIGDDIKGKHRLLVELVEAANGTKYKYNYYQSLWYPNVLDKLSTDYPALALDKMTPEEFAKRLTETALKNK
ncbi:sugar ABC transporter substrate-binding protein [Wukongibacter baidiensis]|uniref:ABC transporter substrate-binding protein n=1 Tax=Wukongibacter baidiensis TaxID=1723361 RepID=UPI003D7FBD86